jgi:glutamyl-tRNA synthetase
MTAESLHPYDQLTPDVVLDALASVGDDAGSVLSAGMAALDAVADDAWSTENIQAALNAALIEQMELKPRVAFGPLRVALSGARISPPLFESMEILGKAETLARLTRLASTL